MRGDIFPIIARIYPAMRSAFILAILSLLLLPITLTADEKGDAAKDAEARVKIEQWINGLKFQTGKVPLGGGLATATIPPGFKYLNGQDSAKLLTLFGNPPQSNLGTIFPEKTDLLKDADAWFVVIQYDEDGYVKDDDAEKINYADLLKQMQNSIRESSAERAKQGYSSLKLIGWATPPRYDRGSHKLFWAKEIQFGGSPENTLNYNIRMLGRKGVLVLNAVAGMNKLAEIEAATPQILAMADFNEGNRYTDFDKSKDKVATYGIAGLVLGAAGLKIAAKVGLLAVAGKYLAVLWKPIVAAAVGLSAFMKRFFTKREQ